MLPTKANLTYRETTSNRRVLFGEVEGKFKDDDLSTLVLKYSPLRGIVLPVPYRIDANPQEGVPIMGKFDGRESSTHELNIGNLHRVKIVFYYNNQEAGVLEITANPI